MNCRAGLACLLIALLAGCGGGGDEPAPAPATTVPPVTTSAPPPVPAGPAFGIRAAEEQLIRDTTPLQFRLQGTSFGVVVDALGAVEQFPLQEVRDASGALTGYTKRSTSVVSSATTASTPSVSTRLDTYGPDLSYRSSAFVQSGELIEVTSFTHLPATARIGDSGPYYTAQRYLTPDKSILVGTSTVTWRLDPGEGGNAILVLISREVRTTGEAGLLFTNGIRVAPGGGAKLLSETYLEPLIMTNLVSTYL